jgi:GDP-D-mannose 3',5'-epimerase
MNSDIVEPINLGSDEMVSINQLVDVVSDIAGISLRRKYNLDAPKGVRGRSSDNTQIREYLGWAPAIRLRDGLEKTYAWIFEEMLKGESKDAVVNLDESVFARQPATA